MEFCIFRGVFYPRICIILFSSASLHMAGMFQTFLSNNSEPFLVQNVIQPGIQAIRLHLENTAAGYLQLISGILLHYFLRFSACCCVLVRDCKRRLFYGIVKCESYYLKIYSNFKKFNKCISNAYWPGRSNVYPDVAFGCASLALQVAEVVTGHRNRKCGY